MGNVINLRSIREGFSQECDLFTWLSTEDVEYRLPLVLSENAGWFTLDLVLTGGLRGLPLPWRNRIRFCPQALTRCSSQFL